MCSARRRVRPPMGLSARKVLGAAAVLFVSSLSISSTPVQAETLREALASAYSTNPTLNAERAGLRATDEGVPQALSGYRPEVVGAGEVERTYTNTRLRTAAGTVSTSDDRWPRAISITISQPLFQGFRVVNSVRQAEKLVKAAREALLNTEQNTLFEAVQAYVDVLSNLSIVDLRRNNVKVLREQLRATQDRFDVGEVTRTDVAQAEARLAGAVSSLSLSEADLSNSRAEYRRVIGHAPASLTAPRSIASLLPNSVTQALELAELYHPAIKSTVFSAEAAGYNIDVVKGELLPTISLEGTYTRSRDTSSSLERADSATISLGLSVPIYQGGSVSSRVREAKETHSQRRIEVVTTRRQVRAAVISAWGQLESATAQIRSDRAQVNANQIALSGVREEANVGQRTVLDVLDAQQELLNAQVSLINSQRNEIVAAYALLSAVGKLKAEKLRLPVKIYDPLLHYSQVRNKWFGLGLPGAN